MMKKILLVALFAAASICLPVSAQDTSDPTNELKFLLAKVRADAQSGMRTEDELSGDIQQFDDLLARHKGEKTDVMAKTLYLKARIYEEAIGDTNKADALMKQLKSEYAGTQFVAQIEEQEAREIKAKKTRDSLTEGTQFPDFDEKDVMGKPLSLVNYKGKVVMIDFWATWCIVCRIELPNVLATYQKYHNKGFEIIGISLDSDQKQLLDFIKENGMPWQQYFDGQGWDSPLGEKYGVEIMPTTYLLDRNGKIIGKNLRGEELTDMVAKAVANK